MYKHGREKFPYLAEIHVFVAYETYCVETVESSISRFQTFCHDVNFSRSYVLVNFFELWTWYGFLLFPAYLDLSRTYWKYPHLRNYLAHFYHLPTIFGFLDTYP